MRAAWVSGVVVLLVVALQWMPEFAPVSPPSVLAQAGAAPQQPGRGGGGRQGGAPNLGWGQPCRERRAAARRAAVADRPVHLEELLQGPRAVAGQALLPLQQLDRAVAVLGLAAPSRRQFPRHGHVGRLQPRHRPAEHPESVSVQDGAGTLRGAAGRGEEEGRPDRLHQGDRARLGRVLPARQHPSGRVVGVGCRTALDPGVLAHAGVSAARRSADVPRGGEQRAAVERLLLLSRRGSSAGGAGHPARRTFS